MPRNKVVDKDSRRVLAVLREHYQPLHPDAAIEVYRYNSACIRIRIISPHFADERWGARDREVWPLLRAHLDDDLMSQISLVLLLAPDEQAGSVMNAEFDDPIPSRL